MGLTEYRRKVSRRRGRIAQTGLTLIEVMIALLIGAILTLVAAQIFISANAGYRTNEAMARIQENGRYAIGFLRRDIQSADFWGCAGPGATASTVAGGPTFPGTGISGVDNAAAPDSITLQGARGGNRRRLVTQMPNTAANMFLNDSAGLAQGDIVMVTDCDSSDVFMVTGNNPNNDNIQHNAGINSNGVSNTTQALSRAYGPQASLYAVRETSYRVNADAELQRSVNGGAWTTMVADVAGMEISYGVDFGGNFVANTYVDAGEFPDVNGDGNPDWENVVSVRVDLLLRSGNDNIRSEAQTGIWDFNGDGTADDAPDRRLYQPFSATVSIRNRLP